LARTRRPAADTGSTLTELLVVIAVLGILATIVVLVVRGVRDEAAASTCAIEHRTIERGVDTWNELHTGAVDMESLVEAGIIREDSQHFTIKPNGNVVPRPDSECAGMLRPAAGGAGQGGAGAGSGGDEPGFAVSSQPLEVTLSWTGNVDADIWVQSPTGDLLGWANRQAAGGVLDLDVIPATPLEMGPHIERVVWQSGDAPIGAYQAWARFETNGWGDQIDATYTVTFRTGDSVLATAGGAIGPQGTVSTPLTADLT
jgi:hypothetical protein